MPRNKTLFWLDLGVLCGYAAAVLVAVAYHEPWGDEAQAWLIARDLPLGKMMFSEMHYEVSPGLWHAILWIGQHFFHAPYAAMNFIGAVLAIVGAAVLIFFAPFPRIVRYLMASSYYVSYQYAVVARPYVLMLLCGGVAAIFYRRRQMVPLALALAAMCGISIHGAILAGALAAGAAFRAIRDWKNLDGHQRRRCLIASVIMLIAFATVFVIAYPAHDVVAMNSVHGGGLSKLARTLPDITFGPWPLAAALLIAFLVFAAWRKQTVPAVLGMGGLLVFHAFVYGAPHHVGVTVIAIIVVLWISWPEPGETVPPQFGVVSLIVLSAVFGVQTYWAASAWRHEITNPYSGSKAAAAYLHSIGADRELIEGFHFGSVAIQPYFDHNLFENWATAYVHHSREAEPLLSKLDRGLPPPEYMIVESENGDTDQNQALLAKRGYEPIQVFPGRILFKDDVWQTDSFTIYRRVGN